NVTVTSSEYGIYFYSGKDFTIRDCTIDGNAGGIIYGGNRAIGDAIVEDTAITNNIGSGLRIDLTEGKSATIRNNKVDNNAGSSSDGIYVYIAGTGGLMTIENNPVTNSGRRGIYLRGVRAGSTVANFTVHDSGASGIRADASDLTIENVTVTSSEYGIYFYSGKDFTIRDCTIDGNAGGIIYGGNRAIGDAIVEDTTITNNIGSGLRIDLTEGKSVTVRNNKIDNNAGSSSDGIYVYIAGTGGVATIKNNLVEDSGRYGIYLTGATNSVVAGNDIMRNSYGMYLHSSLNNSISHNDFIDNYNYNAKDDSDSNSWDDGYPSAGNYWSDHGGADDFKGPGQNQSGKDGIIDTPYLVQGGSGEDRYPLVKPWPLKGDLNSDHLPTPADAAIALQIAATGAHDDAADVSGDGSVTSLDALMILQAAAGRIEL
ncbi:MAG: right-handed parallel beta-helix repeat-containing protein, partial [Euryarchaeota archaeon]|nr:right-handed parallel beta-helix repeat-containing protein [Euryarchaeota archaeon]